MSPRCPPSPSYPCAYQCEDPTCCKVVTFGRLLNPLLLVSTGRGEKRAEKWTCLYHSHSLFSVTEDCLETKSSVRHLAYPPNRMNYHMCVLFLLNFTSYANVNLLNAIFFFIPNSHGFMGKERLNKQTKKSLRPRLHYICWPRLSLTRPCLLNTVL